MKGQFIGSLIAVFALASGPAWAKSDPYGEAKAANAAGDFAKTLSIVKPLADKDDPKALVILGDLYRDGNGVEMDRSKARELYESAILKDPNLGDAMVSMGLLYEKGWKVDQDAKKAVAFYRAALSNKGHGANAAMGRMYLNGTGVEQDTAKAISFFEKGIAQGESEALVEMGLYHQSLSEKGSKESSEKAVKLFREAGEAGNGKGWRLLGIWHSSDQHGAYEPRKTMDYYDKGAKLGDPIAMLNLGIAYADGNEVVAKDEAKAREWFKRAEMKTFRVNKITSKRIDDDGSLILCYGPYLPDENEEADVDEDCQKMVIE